MNSVEQMASVLGFVVHHQGGEIKLPMDVFRNPPAGNQFVELFIDDETDEMVIKLVKHDAGE